jgi:hypothetical protein
MESLNFNDILNRNDEVQKFKDILNNFENIKSTYRMNKSLYNKNINSNTLSPEEIKKYNDLKYKNEELLYILKKGIYIYGNSGIGKTKFITDLLNEMEYDVINYNSSDLKNQNILENITRYNMSDKNILHMFNRKENKIAIIMDDIDNMGSGDKGGINSLIKLIRPKKTKKQRLEDMTILPIICIGNYQNNKKIKELIKVCNVIELKTPTDQQIKSILNQILFNITPELITNIINYVQGDINKLLFVYDIYKTNIEIFDNGNINCLFELKSCIGDTNIITSNLLNNAYNIDKHTDIINETDRTTVGLLWHENIIDLLDKLPINEASRIYKLLLDDICFADYIYRVTFQKQIWQLNEISSLIKTFKTNKYFHDNYTKKIHYEPQNIRFTKVLTKYSTEYNNYGFIQKLCYKLGMNKSDLFSFFTYQEQLNNMEQLLQDLELYNINELDVNRMYKYIARLTKEVELDDNTYEIEYEK